mmetsp:Transcript_60342/g.127813  ORF Transcript_60342/g.127813 Transcript_60342/m.127813 type:complete len:315 (+) Transcript_60342:362-1306(+)
MAFNEVADSNGADAGAGSPLRRATKAAGGDAKGASMEVRKHDICDNTNMQDDLLEYGRCLGLDVKSDDSMLWIVEEAFHAPLPVSWSEHMDNEGRIYFYDETSEESSWEHPMDPVYRELIALVQQAKQDPRLSQPEKRAFYIHGHLKEVHQSALKHLEHWSGPYTSSEGDYYYNQLSRVSTWDCPVDLWEQELGLRHRVLCKALLPEGASVSKSGNLAHASRSSDRGRKGTDAPGSSPERSAGSKSGTEDTPMRSTSSEKLLLNLKLPLQSVDNAGVAPATPSTSRSFHTGRSAVNSSRSLKGALTSRGRQIDK